MNDLLGDQMPDIPAMTDPLPMRVFRLTDSEWWMARTLVEAIADYVDRIGKPPDTDAYEVPDADLDRLWFVESHPSKLPNVKMRCSFRQELARRVVAGVIEPEMFACTEN